MRENMGLYRGKRTYNSEWVEGGIVHQTGFYGHFVDRWFIIDGTTIGEDDIGTFEPEVDPDTVGEDTGLTDKNGKRIFEGDVVSGLFLYALPLNGVCVFQDGAFGLEWERGGAKEFTAFTSMCNVEFEVVGNVHDNPELKGES